MYGNGYQASKEKNDARMLTDVRYLLGKTNH